MESENRGKSHAKALITMGDLDGNSEIESNQLLKTVECQEWFRCSRTLLMEVSKAGIPGEV